MATKEYVIQAEHAATLASTHYHGVSISTLNTWAKNNIPSDAVVSSIRVEYSGKISLGTTTFYIGFTNDISKQPAQTVDSGSLSTSKMTRYTNLPRSGYNINTSYSMLNVWMKPGITKQTTCYGFKVIYTYSVPTTTSYRITVRATPSVAGTVSGGGTYQAGMTADLIAAANSGYKFVCWRNDRGEIMGVSNRYRHTVQGDATFYAVFEPDKINKIYDGTSRPKAIYVGTDEVESAYVGTTKVYG